MTAADIATALRGRRSGRGWTARCPAHEDRSPSLSITESGDRILIHCHAGCEQANVIEALRARGLWPERERPQRTPAERARWAAERRDIERDLPNARPWRRAAVNMIEDLLHALKSALIAPDLPQPDVGEIGRVTALLARLRGAGDAELVAEYRQWQSDNPGMTAAMVRWARARERMERAQLSAYLRHPAQRKATA